MNYKNMARIAVGTGLILLIPWVAMQFTDEVNWSLADFIVMGVLLFGTGLALDGVMRKAGKYRVAAAIGVILAFFYIWAELAVGIFTNWGN